MQLMSNEVASKEVMIYLIILMMNFHANIISVCDFEFLECRLLIKAFYFHKIRHALSG